MKFLKFNEDDNREGQTLFNIEAIGTLSWGPRAPVDIRLWGGGEYVVIAKGFAGDILFAKNYKTAEEAEVVYRKIFLSTGGNADFI